MIDFKKSWILVLVLALGVNSMHLSHDSASLTHEQTCPQHAVYNSTTQQCVCTAGTVLNTANNLCQCPLSAPYFS